MFKRTVSTALFCLVLAAAYSQSIHGKRDAEWQALYRATPEKVFELRHTRLNVKFDFAKRHLLGEEWVTLRPYFYPQNQLVLDAKGMLIHEVKSGGRDLKFDYNGETLNIVLDKTYSRNDSLQLYIRYTARPDEVKQEGSRAITSAKGLYFIDPDETDPEKPTQIWTQGETEASSCWFPTLDVPNQKTTEEISITVPQKFTTLSNGTLVSQTPNADGTRTDYWKFMMPHAPYLFYMGIGEFAVVRDKWRNIPVDYYVEKKYEPYAQGIFGKTPEMIEFFSKATGVDYPWPKYSQMICRDYVSGAMENTTAVIHAEQANQNDKQLNDENGWEDVISHELFHHWFGDYVTCESWSNLTVNESFANYSEYLWREHKYGRDHADQHLMEDVEGYLRGGNEQKDLVRFTYDNKEDMFDGVSYNKGGAILHMLRAYLGDEAFFGGLNKYLNDNKFGTGEAHQLRLALEAVSGKDLNVFFNQWYFGSGHPRLDIDYAYDAAAKQVRMNVKQSQSDNLFYMPMTVDVYEASGKTSHTIQIGEREETFTFPAVTEPLLVNADADHVLLAQISENKNLANYAYQLKNAPRYLDRKQATDYLLDHQDEKPAYEALIAALDDPYYGIREDILSGLDFGNKAIRKAALPKVEKLAKEDKYNPVKAAALKLLGETGSKDYVPLFQAALKMPSYSLMGAGLDGLYETDKKAAVEFAKTYKDDGETGEDMAATLMKIYIEEKEPAGMPFVAKQAFLYKFIEDEEVKKMYEKGYNWVLESDNVEANKTMLDEITAFGIRYAQYGVLAMAQMEIMSVKAKKEAMLAKRPDSANLKTQLADIDKALARLAEEGKK